MAISTIGASALDSNVTQLGKNLIQNGSFAVSQRGSVSGIGGSQTYTTCDRFKLFFGTGSEQGRVTTDRKSVV